jgi:competence CoiA-like predicted nuclease
METGMELFAGFKRTLPRARIPCIDCGGQLVLKWGDVRRPHFAHLSKTECNGAESTTHLLYLFQIIKFSIRSKFKDNRR